MAILKFSFMIQFVHQQATEYIVQICNVRVGKTMKNIF